MFDPSKLNLDLDNLDNNDNQENTNIQDKKEPQDIQKEEKSETTNQNTEKKDILDFKDENSKTEPETKQEKSNNSENDAQKIEEDKKEETKPVKEKNEIKKEEENKIIFDINLNSAEVLLAYLTSKQYDFFTIEPEEDKVKINFFKDKILKETKYIKYPIYNKILIKLKSLSKLKVEITDKTQEWTWEIVISGKSYKVLAKTVPTNFWEKIFIKTQELQKKVVKKQTKKTSIWTIFWFLWAIVFIALTLGWAFISFVVMNAKTVEDVRFFYSLWINLNDINNFIETAIWVIFSIIVLLEILALVIFLFKFLFTKKEFKKKRITRWIISTFILIITFITVSTWMFIDKKIKALPNWQELAYWNIQILDNDLLKKSDTFNREAALLTETTNLIWPENIKFDLKNFAKSEEEKGIKIKKYKWEIWKEKFETLEPTLIHKFNQKWTYNVNLVLEELDLHWDIVDKVVENIPSIEISHIVNIEEEKLDNWWKIVKFDASDLKDLWKIDWYFITDINDPNIKPVFTWYKFNPAKVIFEDTIVWFQIQKEDRSDDNLDKIFVIEAVKQNEIKWKIEIKQDPIDDLKYTFSVKDINSDFGNWFIEEFKWKIDNIKTKTLKSDIDNIEKSSEFKIKFKKYWKHIIKVDLKDSNWNIKTLEKEFEIKKNIKLKNTLEFFNENKELENVEYKESTHEYFIRDLKVPTNLEINAKNVESENILDYLEKIQWDIWGDWDIDEEGKILNYEIPKWGSYQIDVIYTFQNKRLKDQITKLKETIYIDAEKKEVLLNLKINKPRDYVPVRVGFDASSSYVKWKDIAKFIFDYWDGTPPDVRDAKNPWHRYIKPGDYTVKLTVVTTDWKEYSIEKKLVLKPQPQDAKITASMKTAPIYTAIDFSSNKSSWEIISYFWDFGDGETSTDANPSHMFKKPWTYKVKLTLDYKNKNTLSDEVEIKITDE